MVDISKGAYTVEVVGLFFKLTLSSSSSILHHTLFPELVL